MQQYHSNTGDGSLSVFLAELVQRHLESVLAANVPESLTENTTYDQQPEAPGGGGDDVQPEPPSEKKQMSEEEQALVLQCEERVKGLAWKFARVSSGVDVEEFSSIGMLAVCEVVARRETLLVI